MIKVAFTGDILTYPNQNKQIKNKFGNYNYHTVFEHVSTIFNNADYVCGSLETPICPSKKLSENAIVFNTPLSFLDSIKEIGIGLLNTANNHCFDRGVTGLKSTIKSIKSKELDYTGTRLSSKESNYFVKSIGGCRIAFLAYTYDTNGVFNNVYLNYRNSYLVNLTKKQFVPSGNIFIFKLKSILKYLLGLKKRDIQYPTKAMIDSVTDENIDSVLNERYLIDMKKSIAEAKANSDVLFFCLHAGGQFNSTVGNYTNFLVDEIVNAGANIVICNHTHSVLPIELKNNSFVAYSLGNFSFTPNEGYYINGVYADYSIVLYVNISDKDITFSFRIVKNVVDGDGISRVYPIDSIYNSGSSQICRDQIKEDVINVLKRIGLKDIPENVIRDEYIIDGSLLNTRSKV